VALEFGEMRQIETSGLPRTACAAGLDFLLRGSEQGFSRACQIPLNQGGCGCLFLCEELSA
jgi:hypothetical protein